jgi:hypothetical protein
MPVPTIAPLPPDLDLPAGWTIRVNALSPTDGSQVTGVVVSDFSLLVTDLTGGGGTGSLIGPFMLVPGPNA